MVFENMYGFCSFFFYLWLYGFSPGIPNSYLSKKKKKKSTIRLWYFHCDRQDVTHLLPKLEMGGTALQCPTDKFCYRPWME